MGTYLSLIVWGLILWLVVGVWRLRKRRVSIGPAASAMMAELLDDQRRAAVEIILEERTGARNPEDRDGNLPDLAQLGRGTSRDQVNFNPPIDQSATN